MQCLVVYDIPNDRARTKIADLCLDYGLDRIQFSAFMGDMARTHQEALMKEIKKALGKKAGNVQLVTICEKDWRQRIVIEQKETAEAEEPKASPRKRTGAAKTGAQPPAQPEREILWMPEREEEELPPF